MPLKNESQGRAKVDLNSVGLFVAAAQAGSLGEAAPRTGVPLATLSRRVRSLEESLGVRLVERSTQGLTLTDAGARLFASAAPALALLTQAEHDVHDASGVSGTLRISMPPHFEPLWETIEAFGQRHSGVRFDILVTDRRVDLAADGIDVAIRVGEGGRATLIGRTLARYRHRLVAAPAYLETLSLRQPEDLRHARCACWRSAATPTWHLGETAVALVPVVATNDYQHLLRLALGGRVVTELPPFLAHAPLGQGRLGGAGRRRPRRVAARGGAHLVPVQRPAVRQGPLPRPARG